MTVYRPLGRKRYRFDFHANGRRYLGNTGQLRLKDARAWEYQYRVKLARAAGDLPLEAAETPRFSDWAQVYLAHLRRLHRKPAYIAQVERLLRIVLGFWGAAPRKPLEGGVYHDLRLGDPIVTPSWITDFDTWLATRGSQKAATRTNCLAALSGLYRVAMLPQHRTVSGIRQNPFLGVPRERSRGRALTITVEDFRRWLQAASPHVQLALAIGALAPKLRLQNVLGLRWDQHIDPDYRWITVTDHKTSRRTGPLVVPIVEDLRRLLEHARARGSKIATHVITWRGEPVSSIRTGLRRAAAKAGIPYGLAKGATFHSLRHQAATLLAELDVSEAKRQSAMGHTELRTTQRYTHLRPEGDRAPLEQLAALLDLGSVFEGAGGAAGPRVIASIKRGRNKAFASKSDARRSA